MSVSLKDLLGLVNLAKSTLEELDEKKVSKADFRKSEARVC